MEVFNCCRLSSPVASEYPKLFSYFEFFDIENSFPNIVIVASISEEILEVDNKISWNLIE